MSEMDLANMSDCQYSVIQESFKNLDLSVNKRNRRHSVKEQVSESVTESSTNRRFSLRPRKRSSLSLNNNIDEDSDETDLVNIYNLENKKPKLDSVSKRKHSHLETIFEEPVVNKRNGSVKLIGTSKVKRSITFSDYITKTKEKKRKAQIKKLNITGRNRRSCIKMSLKDVEIKLDEIDANLVTVIDLK